MDTTSKEITREKLDAEFDQYLTIEESLEQRESEDNGYSSDSLIEELCDLDALDARLIIYEQATEIEYLRKIMKVRELRRKVQTKLEGYSQPAWEGESLDSLHKLVNPTLTGIDRVIGN